MRFCLVAFSIASLLHASSASHATAAVVHRNIRLTAGAVWLVRAADRAARGGSGSCFRIETSRAIHDQSLRDCHTSSKQASTLWTSAAKEARVSVANFVSQAQEPRINDWTCVVARVQRGAVSL